MESFLRDTKVQKKKFKRAKRRAIGPWKILTIISAPVTLILTALAVFCTTFDNSLSVFVGGTFNDIKNRDESAVYYDMDFDSAEEMVQYGNELCRQVEAEGAALLMNENETLPLDEGSKVSCFSTSSVNLVYGGTGSGNIDASEADTLKSALETAGFEVNQALWDFYLEDAAEYKRKKGSVIATESAAVSECPWDVYTDEAKESVSAYGDAAIAVLSRVGGEGADLAHRDVNYLALDEHEKKMLENIASMKAGGTVQKIIVLINSANALQVDFLKENQYDIDACLWIGDVGISGIHAVAQILSGRVNPSGSLVDTYCYNNFSAPAMANFTPVTYEGYKKGVVPEHAATYMIYQEGIYVGYKYYETRYEDFVMETGNAGGYSYQDDVAFPFGYGLSYTDFKYKDFSVKYKKSTDQFVISVTVKNTGEVYAGKETVQIYAQSPYTAYDVKNGVEKPAVFLCGFGKTGKLEPGASETLKIRVSKRDLASYDAYGAGTYMLDKDLGGREITYLSRSDWEGTFPSVPLRLMLTDVLAKKLQDVQYEAQEGAKAQMPVLGEDNGRKLVEMMGLSFDDPQWEELLNQLSFDDMVSLIGDSFHWTMPVESVQAPGTRDENGPQGLTASLFRAGENKGKTALTATAFTSEDVMAATFNTQLMYEIGRVIANNCIAAEIACLYGPGSNIHRTPYGGRNFEYYSEDAFLSGMMAKHEVQAMTERGIFVVMKHFALNDCEQDRIGLGVWLNEQAAREIYLKAFQAAVEESNAGLMVAYTRWGAVWSGANKGLMNNILRGEWGKKGLIITDNVLTTYVNGVDGVLAGGVSTFDAMLPYVTRQLPKYKNDPAVVAAMKEACHHNLYSIANSAGMNGIGPGTVIKKRNIVIVTGLWAASIAAWLLLAVSAVLWIIRKQKFKQTEVYRNYWAYQELNK